MIHLRKRPDAPPAEPHECGETMGTTLYDLPTYPPHIAELCGECKRVRLGKNRGTFRSLREGSS